MGVCVGLTFVVQDFEGSGGRTHYLEGQGDLVSRINRANKERQQQPITKIPSIKGSKEKKLQHGLSICLHL